MGECKGSKPILEVSKWLPILIKGLDPTVSCVALLREVYVVDRGNNCIQVFLQKKKGKCVTINTTRQLNAPSDLAIDTKLGRSAVSDSFWVDKIAMFETII